MLRKIKSLAKSMPQSMRHLGFRKAGWLAITLVAVLILSSNALATSGYSLDWWTVDGGGNTLWSGIGVYSVRGTIGQADAGTWQGAPYTLQGGFWGGEAPQFDIYLPILLR